MRGREDEFEAEDDDEESDTAFFLKFLYVFFFKVFKQQKRSLKQSSILSKVFDPIILNRMLDSLKN